MKTANRHQGAHETTRRGGDHSLTGELREGVSQLGEDVSELMHTAASVGQAGAEAVRDTAAEAIEGVGRQIGALKEKAIESTETVGKQMASRPFTTAMIAFGAGYLFARFCSRK